MFWSLLRISLGVSPCSQGLLQPSCQALGSLQHPEFSRFWRTASIGVERGQSVGDHGRSLAVVRASLA